MLEWERTSTRIACRKLLITGGGFTRILVLSKDAERRRWWRWIVENVSYLIAWLIVCQRIISVRDQFLRKTELGELANFTILHHDKAVLVVKRWSIIVQYHELFSLQIVQALIAYEIYLCNSFEQNLFWIWNALQQTQLLVFVVFSVFTRNLKICFW